MTSVMLYKVLDRDGKPLMVDGEIEQFTLGVANQRAHSIGGRYLPIRETEIVTTPAQQATFITVTVTLKMTPEQRTLYAYGRTDGPDTAPDDVAGRVRARIGEALAEPWIRRFTHASVGEPKIEDLPRCQHRCQQGKHCGGCGCRGCRYDAPPSLFDPEPELPAGTLAHCSECGTRLIKRGDGKWAPTGIATASCTSGVGHIPQRATQLA